MKVTRKNLGLLLLGILLIIGATRGLLGISQPAVWAAVNVFALVVGVCILWGATDGGA